MKIAIVAYALKIGGMESLLLGLAARMTTLGASVTFVVTQSMGEWHDRPLQQGLAIEAVLPRGYETRRGHALRVARVLKQFDAVLVNHSLTAQSSLGFLPESTVTVSVLHGNAGLVYDVGLANIANVDMVVAVSEAVYREALRRGSPAERTACVRNGVETFESYPKRAPGRDEGELSRPLKAAYVGRIEQSQKGALHLPGILTKAIAAGASLSVDVIGTGEGDYAVLRQQMAGLEQQGVVQFHGALPHDQAMSLLLAADVLLMPSHSEGQPIILFEAMARGVVPVVSLLPGITDAVVTHKENGLLSPVGDESSFADALVAIDKDRRWLASMSVSAWETASSNFSDEATAKKYMELINVCRLRRQRGELPARTRQLCYEVLGRCSWRIPVMYRFCGKIEQLMKRRKR